MSLPVGNTGLRGLAPAPSSYNVTFPSAVSAEQVSRMFSAPILAQREAEQQEAFKQIKEFQAEQEKLNLETLRDEISTRLKQQKRYDNMLKRMQGYSPLVVQQFEQSLGGGVPPQAQIPVGQTQPNQLAGIPVGQLPPESQLAQREILPEQQPMSSREALMTTPLAQEMIEQQDWEGLAEFYKDAERQDLLANQPQAPITAEQQISLNKLVSNAERAEYEAEKSRLDVEESKIKLEQMKRENSEIESFPRKDKLRIDALAVKLATLTGEEPIEQKQGQSDWEYATEVERGYAKYEGVQQVKETKDAEKTQEKEFATKIRQRVNKGEVPTGVDEYEIAADELGLMKTNELTGEQEPDVETYGKLARAGGEGRLLLSLYGSAVRGEPVDDSVAKKYLGELKLELKDVIEGGEFAEILVAMQMASDNKGVIKVEDVQRLIDNFQPTLTKQENVPAQKEADKQVAAPRRIKVKADGSVSRE